MAGDRRIRTVATVLAACALAATTLGGLAGCGGGSDSTGEALSAELDYLRHDQGLTKEQVDCVATEVRRGRSEQQLRAFEQAVEVLRLGTDERVDPAQVQVLATAIRTCTSRS